MNVPQLYSVVPNQDAFRWSKYPNIEGFYPWKLPSVKCPACGIVWGTSTVAYPCILLPAVPHKRRYAGNAVCVLSPEELEEARRPLREILNADSPLPPGTSFGRFKGKLTSGELEDFHFYYYPRLITRKAFERLQTAATLKLIATPANIRHKRTGEAEELLDFHLLPRAQLTLPKVQKAGEKYCLECGFDQRSLPDPMVVRKSSIPENEDLFQLMEATSIVLAKPAFVEAVRALRLTGLDFEEVAVDD